MKFSKIFNQLCIKFHSIINPLHIKGPTPTTHKILFNYLCQHQINNIRELGRKLHNTISKCKSKFYRVRALFSRRNKTTEKHLIIISLHGQIAHLIIMSFDVSTLGFENFPPTHAHIKLSHRTSNSREISYSLNRIWHSMMMVWKLMRNLSSGHQRWNQITLSSSISASNIIVCK